MQMLSRMASKQEKRRQGKMKSISHTNTTAALCCPHLDADTLDRGAKMELFCDTLVVYCESIQVTVYVRHASALNIHTRAPGQGNVPTCATDTFALLRT
jgi:hypothetical protein